MLSKADSASFVSDQPGHVPEHAQPEAGSSRGIRGDAYRGLAQHCCIDSAPRAMTACGQALQDDAPRKACPPIKLVYYHFHNAIRAELDALAGAVLALEPLDGSALLAQLQLLKRRYQFLEQVYSIHSSVEDEVRRARHLLSSRAQHTPARLMPAVARGLLVSFCEDSLAQQVSFSLRFLEHLPTCRGCRAARQHSLSSVV